VQETDDEGSAPPTVELSDVADQPSPNRDTYAFSRSAIVGAETERKKSKSAKTDILEEKLKAIAQVLASFQLLEQLSKKRQEQLLRAIYRILGTEG